MVPVWVLVAVVAVAMVAEAVVLVGYISSLPSAQSPTPLVPPFKPVVLLAAARTFGLGENVTVASVSQGVELGNFQVNLEVNNTLAGPRLLPFPTGYVVVGIAADNYRVNWSDTGNRGLLGSGDSFVITRTNATGTAFKTLPPSSSFIFYLLWVDGSTLTNVTWSTVPVPVKPLVIFSSVTKVNSYTWTFSVASASPTEAPSNFKVNFGMGTATGTAVTMGTSGQNVSVTTGGTPAIVGVKWTDIGGEDTVNAGDQFTITFPSAPTSGTSLTFYLLFLDGSLIQSVNWQA